jgi:acyl-CoA synthetase (AMP-forming)/AMP-acid ligase II
MDTTPRTVTDSASPALELGPIVAARAAGSGERTYLEDARSGTRLTYAQLLASVHRWVPRFDAALAGAGAVVLDVADPLRFGELYVSAISGGFQAVPTDPSLSTPDLAKIVALLAPTPTVVVTDRAEGRRLPGIPVLRSEADEAGTAARATGAGTAGEASPGAAAAPGAVGLAADACLRPGGSALLFTSGSTGTPKGVPLSSDQLLSVAQAVAAHNRLTPADRGFNPLPLFHVNAEVVGLLAVLVSGSTLVLDRRFHATGFWELIDARRITWINAVPAILAVLAHAGTMPVPPQVRFIRTASAPLPEAVRGLLGDVPLVISYGMTEGASQITATPLDAPLREGSVGVPVGCELQVRGPDHRSALPAGSVGALWIRGRGIVRSYYRGRAAERFDADGWLRTGDLGRVDADGYAYLVGRSDDVINRGGEMVYPADIEEVLLGDQRVREAVVVARPDPILHQVPYAYIVPAADEAGSGLRLADDLQQRCERQLPRYKRPVHITVVDDLPRAPTGKIRRAQVRAMAAAA